MFVFGFFLQNLKYTLVGEGNCGGGGGGGTVEVPCALDGAQQRKRARKEWELVY